METTEHTDIATRALTEIAEFGPGHGDRSPVAARMRAKAKDALAELGNPRALQPRIDPFIFVMAVRYAIHRWLTSAAEVAANHCIVWADTIKRDQGATQ